MDANERTLLTATIHQLVAADDGTELTASLDAFGWLELLDNDFELAVSTVFEALGRFNRWSSALHDVMAQGLTDLPGRATFDSTVVIPRPRHLETGVFRGKVLSICGLLLQPRSRASLVVVTQGDDDVNMIVEVSSAQLQFEAKRGLDTSIGFVSVTGDCTAWRVLAMGDDATRWWNVTVAHARSSLSHALVASMQRMLELATEHAISRRQFGRPIGSFQAVRHRLAESLVAVEGARSVVEQARHSNQVELAAATAKLVASNAVKVVTGHAQQVLAGIGFTAEHEFHRFMERAILLDRLFSNATDLATTVGEELVSLGHAPRLFELRKET